MSLPQRKGCDTGHVQSRVWAKLVAACLTKALNAWLHPEEKLILPPGQMPVKIRKHGTTRTDADLANQVCVPFMQLRINILLSLACPPNFWSTKPRSAASF